MAGRGQKNSQRARIENDRARLHAARTDWHEGQIRRRRRDNTIAGVLGGVLLAAVIASQVVHAQVNPPAPEPTPSETSVPAPEISPEVTDLPAPTDTPAP
ncbi:MAG: hypothetical protein ACQEW8_02245 [Actinomycetota bacterium]